MFYEFLQNNSGGSFTIDNLVCHRLFIEAANEIEAVIKAESLGCYWNGVEDGFDCDCCGDRWSEFPSEIDISELSKKVYTVSIPEFVSEPEKMWQEAYGKFLIITEPKWVVEKWGNRYEGAISIKTIEDYAQYLANTYNHTVPDSRIFFMSGDVKEFIRTSI